MIKTLKQILFCTIIFGGFLIYQNAFAACSWSGLTGLAASCSTDEVSSCVTDASSKTGEVVINLPSCSVTWSSPVAVNMSSGWTNVTALTIQGNGSAPTTGSAGNTVLNNGGFTLTTKTTKKIRVSNITLTGTGTANSSNFFWITGTTKVSLGGGFRLDHISFNGGHALQIYAGDAYGVIDHCNGGTKGQFSGIIWGTDHYLGGGNASWAAGADLGGADAVYFEDNTLVNTDTTKKWMICDGVNGARVVVRYNSLTDYYISGHDASSVDRGIVQYEAYNNYFYSTGSQMNAPIDIRGGTGVIANNDIETVSNNPFYNPPLSGVGMANYRSSGCAGGSVAPWTNSCGSWVKGCVKGNVFLSKTCNSDADCEGVVGSCQNLDGPSSGYPCRDQIGRGKDDASNAAQMINKLILFSIDPVKRGRHVIACRRLPAPSPARFGLLSLCRGLF